MLRKLVIAALLALSGTPAIAQQQYDPGGKAKVSNYCTTTTNGDTPCGPTTGTTGNPTQVNVRQVGGSNTATNAGAATNGSQRVVAAQDTTTIAGSAPGTAGSPSANVVTTQGCSGCTPQNTNMDSIADGTTIASSGAAAGVLSNLPVSTVGYGSVLVYISAFSATSVTPQASFDGGSTYVAVLCAVISSGGGSDTASITGVGVYQCPAGSNFQLTQVGSGAVTAKVTLKRAGVVTHNSIIQSTVNLAPLSSSGSANTPVVSTSLEACHVLKASAGSLYSVSVTIQATSGVLLLLNATSAPSDGAVTPLWSMPVVSNGTFGGGSWEWTYPMRFSTGVTACFSSATTPFTKTGSATAMISGNVQ